MHHVTPEDHVSMVGSGKMIHAIHAIRSRNEVTFCNQSEKIEGHRFSQTTEMPSMNLGLP